jgi:hypothetical protein
MHMTVATWFFGILLLVFLLWVFIWGPDELPAHKQKILAIVAALLCALFSFFFVGLLQIRGKWKKLTIQSGGGSAVFLFVLMWWNTPQIAPIKVKPEISIDRKSLSITRPSIDIPIFTGTISPAELCTQVQVGIQTKGGHACLTRTPICGGGSATWKIDCSLEIGSLQSGIYLIKAMAGELTVADFLNIAGSQEN